jgi:hypothetical protein
MLIICGCNNRRSFIIEFIFQQEQHASSSAESDGVEDRGVSKIIDLIFVAVRDTPSSSFDIISLNSIMKWRPLIVICLELNFSIFQYLIQRYEFTCQYAKQWLALNFNIQVNEINNC